MKENHQGISEAEADKIWVAVEYLNYILTQPKVLNIVEDKEDAGEPIE